MPAEFREAPQVAEIAKRLIPAYHPHLVEANIAYVFRKGEWASKGDVVYAKAVKVSARDAYLHGCDFLLIVNEDHWPNMTPEQHDALIDHELCHCARAIDANGELAENEDGSPKWAIVNHDVEEFRDVLARHGAWNGRLKAFAKTAKRIKVEDQATLDDYTDGGEVATGPAAQAEAPEPGTPADELMDRARGIFAEVSAEKEAGKDDEDLAEAVAADEDFEEDGPLYPRHYCTRCRKQISDLETLSHDGALFHVPAKGECDGPVVRLEPGEPEPTAADQQAAS